MHLTVAASEEEKAQGVMVKHISVNELSEAKQKEFIEDFNEYLKFRKEKLKGTQNEI